ncbi:LysR substrate-binding domain-containing protein [Scleromatobacter humisilvae]|uniref:LysR substrate-binding domain-containing protein n=1 Tax=Scleromatobacter humisilvae TaxID=2897159 RepID=A0A9X1YNX7_9BURK|nr:LysR substrate-binding domain-containing protein [Scleromatobacter humisilvae]MCK9689292.1 LysR substrate-binding domain-containing protein [Scleromatobacter humisilvae]
MNLTWLEDFLALAASGNFSRAAEERASSQPAFSRRIRGLEDWLGVELFDRSSQPATLTQAGEWFRGVAEDLLKRVARLPGDARRIRDADAQALRIAATHALSFTFLPQWLRHLESSAPLGQVRLMSDVLARCEALMQQGQVQFVLSHAHAKAPGALDVDGYRATCVGGDVLVPVSQPDAGGKPRHALSDDEPAAVLQYTDESGLGRILRAVLGRRFDRGHVAFTAHAASVLRTMALDGRGLAWLPETLVRDDLALGRLVPAAGEEWNVPLEVRLYREREPLGPVAEAFWRSATGDARDARA